MERFNFKKEFIMIGGLALVFILLLISSGCYRYLSEDYMTRAENAHELIADRFDILKDQFKEACRSEGENEFCKEYTPKIEKAEKILNQIKIAIKISKPTADLEQKFIEIETELVGLILKELMKQK